MDYMTDEEFAQSGGGYCPKCREPSAEPTSAIDCTGNVAYRAMKCTDCGYTWQENYILHNYQSNS